MIYHYTDLNATKSILENSKLWLTDYNFLNDKQEFNHGFNILIECLEEFDDFPDECSENFIHRFREAVKFIKQDNFSMLEKNKIFVTSFSMAPDSLNQWRSYGMFSVEFNETFFPELQEKEDLYYLDCHYILDYHETKEYAEILIKEKILPVLLQLSDRQHMILMDLELSYLIDIYALSFKDGAFVDEQEMRLVVSCAPDEDSIQFRAKGNILIPYLELELSPLSINSVTIGPIDNQSLSASSLNMLASKISRRVQMNNDNEYFLTIETSDIPFRSL